MIHTARPLYADEDLGLDLDNTVYALDASIHISDGKLHDVNVLDLLILEPGACYIMDRGHVDFERLFTRSVAIFRATRNGGRPISGANNLAPAIAFGGLRSSRRALRRGTRTPAMT